MKSSGSSLSIYVVAIVIAVVIATLVAQCHKSPAGVVPMPPSPSPAPTTVPPAPGAANLPAAPVGQVATLTNPAATSVTIQDGKTIDFSSGKPVIKSDAKEKQLIDSAVKEMDEATRGVTFGPASATPTPLAK